MTPKLYIETRGLPPPIPDTRATRKGRKVHKLAARTHVELLDVGTLGVLRRHDSCADDLD